MGSSLTSCCEHKPAKVNFGEEVEVAAYWPDRPRAQSRVSTTALEKNIRVKPSGSLVSNASSVRSVPSLNSVGPSVILAPQYVYGSTVTSPTHRVAAAVPANFGYMPTLQEMTRESTGPQTVPFAYSLSGAQMMPQAVAPQLSVGMVAAGAPARMSGFHPQQAFYA
eukprot:TRINITY_DN26447_c0_g1_i1.p1 TRINITY_DN26447_c0_g1~~TRINITY_DN26447_c0_g1_i1.p1  ORF type:complete len:166 (+),score=16.21 TRINITY_DN26447_c0_g1_i1:63-560(+)